MDESSSEGDEIDDEELDQMIVNDDYKYTKKQKLGEKVYKIINNRFCIYRTRFIIDYLDIVQYLRQQ